MSVITRFAPSPTGHLHIGGARTAIFSWLLARHFKGQFRFRIEDTDLLRSKQEYTDSILASMKWLGLTWDGELTYQTKRMDLYNKYVDQLLETGHAYWCGCTEDEVNAMRERAKARGLKPRYDGHCRNLNLGPGEGRCVRLKCPLEGKVVFDDMVKGRISVDVRELDDMARPRTTWPSSSTITTWASPTSSAATTTCPTRRARSSSTRPSASRCPRSATCP